MSVYLTISHLQQLREKYVYISNNSSIFQCLQTNSFTYMSINLYIFLKSIFETPCTIIFFHVCCLYVL